jgi:hypothetical protein
MLALPATMMELPKLKLNYRRMPSVLNNIVNWRIVHKMHVKELECIRLR